MAIFYSNNYPTTNDKNTINSIMSNDNIRDYLLRLNLKPSGKYTQFTTNINGSSRVGESVDIISQSNSKPNLSPIDKNYINFKNDNTKFNEFKINNNDLISINNIEKVDNTNFGDINWIDTYPIGVNDEIDSKGLLFKTNNASYRQNLTLKNLYNDYSKQVDVSDYIVFNPNTNSLKGYLDEYGVLNNKSGTDTLNIIGSVLNGQGFGLNGNGIEPNFDVRSSLINRILSSMGVVNDTKLGLIGSRQMALALTNNTLFNLQEEILPSFDLKTGEINIGKKNSSITVPNTNISKVVNKIEDLLGYNVPVSYLDEASSIFQYEKGENVTSLIQNNSLISFTSASQKEYLKQSLLNNLNGIGTNVITNNLFRSGYAPNYRFGKDDISGNTTAYYLTDNLNINDEDLLFGNIIRSENFGFTELNTLFINNDVKSWASDNTDNINYNSNYTSVSTDKKSILNKTQILFNNKKMKNLLLGKGDMNIIKDDITTTNGGGISRGSAVLRGDTFDSKTGRYLDKKRTADETYCRVWTASNRYNNMSNLIRNKGLWDTPTLPYRNVINNSVLDDNGLPKIAPYTDDKIGDPKKFMFSIENLAWHDDYQTLSRGEKGPGDLLTGKHGRIMWFPPYNIQFSESNSVNLETNNFIGRGEPLYTYNNTERIGNLSFQIIVDHPTYINSFRGENGPDDNYVASFFAGCIDPDSEWSKKLTIIERSEVIKSQVTTPISKVVTNEIPPTDLNVYFPNDNSIIETAYENGLKDNGDPIDYNVNKNGEGYGLGIYKANYTPGSHNSSKDVVTDGWLDRYNYGLNYSLNSSYTKETIVGVDNSIIRGYFDENLVDYMVNHLTEVCPHCVATITGYASPQGREPYNTKLANDRATNVKNNIKNTWWPQIKSKLKLNDSDFDKRFKIGKSKTIQESESNCVVPPSNLNLSPTERELLYPTDTIGCKLDRKVVISFSFDEKLQLSETPSLGSKVKNVTKRINSQITNKFYNELNYFDKLKNTDKFIFDSFREKIKYFHPAFHSTTPEGLNSRLNFLLQCTRQGNTMEEQGANNLAFGRPPVCILRIGDFYNTKIFIDTLNIDYEPLVWDLNPEGIGVQPMIANVNLTFKFIGGSSLMGPINKLQNALSFNYFANTQVYDTRADYIIKGNPKIQDNGNDTTTKDSDGTVNVKEINIKMNNYELVNGDLDQSYTTMMSNAVITDGMESISDETIDGFGVEFDYTANDVKISGFKSIYTQKTVNDGVYVIAIILNSENLVLVDDNDVSFLIDDNELNKFLSKNIKFRLLKDEKLIYEEIVPIEQQDNNVYYNNKSASDLFGVNHYHLGLYDIKLGLTDLDELDKGVYILELYYDGKRITSSNIELKDNQVKNVY